MELKGQESDHAVEYLVMSALKQHFKPELLNRLDDIIMFHSLTNEQYFEIAKKYIHLLQKRVAEQEIDLQVNEDVLQWIAAEGVDPAFGARPLRRFVQRNIETLVAQELLKGEATAGDKLVVSMEDGKVAIHKEG